MAICRELPDGMESRVYERRRTMMYNDGRRPARLCKQGVTGSNPVVSTKPDAMLHKAFHLILSLPGKHVS